MSPTRCFSDRTCRPTDDLDLTSVLQDIRRISRQEEQYHRLVVALSGPMDVKLPGQKG